MNLTVAGLLFLICMTALPQRAAAADPARGEALAKRWCASCHVVESGQKHPSGKAAPFSAIAKTPNLSAARLALLLLWPHPKMADIRLSRSEAADLAAYIVTQGQ